MASNRGDSQKREFPSLIVEMNCKSAHGVSLVLLRNTEAVAACAVRAGREFKRIDSTVLVDVCNVHSAPVAAED
jgi:hypothetical protein